MTGTVRHRTGPAALADVAAAFDSLAGAQGSPVTARRRWLQAWIDTHPGWQPWLVTVEDGEELLAAAPLARRWSLRTLEVVALGHGPSDEVRLPARTPEAARTLAAEIAAGLAGRGGWRLRLEQLPAHDPVAAALGERLPLARTEPGDGMPIVGIDDRDPARYLSRNTMKALAKIRNRVRKAGLEPDLRWTSDPGEIRALLPELARVHRERDRALGRRPDHDDPSAAAFYREAIIRHADAGEVDLLTLRLDGDLAAFVCGFRDGRTLRSWDNRLSPRWAELSAGRIANTEAVRHAVCDGGYDALDWMRGEEPYKLQSATDVVPTQVLSAWSSAGVRSACEAGAYARGAARTLKQQNPLVGALVTRTRALR